MASYDYSTVTLVETTLTIDEYSIDDANATTGSKDPEGGIPVSRIIICTGLFIVVVLTIFGNILVIVAFGTQKKLRTSNFMLYITNLAITDLLVAVSAMSFYTFDILLGYWPFGEILCAIWIFFDYGMTFASVFTLVAISLDRFWSVTWSLHYRNHNSRKKTCIVIGVVWVLVLATWLGPCIGDRIKWSEPNVCVWEPSNNKEFVIFIAIFGHHTPCFIMVFCYIWVFCRMQKRRNQTMPLRGKVIVKAETTIDNHTAAISYVGGESSKAPETTQSDSPEHQDAKHKRALTVAEKEKRIFVTLSYVIVSYLICWVPFHVVFDLSAVDPKLVPNTAYVFTFWLTYFNSTLNPLLYAFSSAEFRKAFVNVMKCKWESRKGF